MELIGTPRLGFPGMPEGWPRKNRRPTGRPTDRHAPQNHVRVREFFKQKATFFILFTPPFDFVRVYEARSLSRKLLNMSLF